MNKGSFVCTQLKGLKYSYLILIILFDINHLFARSLNGFIKNKKVLLFISWCLTMLDSNVMIMSVVSDSFFLLLTPLTYLSVESFWRITKGGKEEKRQGYLFAQNFNFGVHDYSVTEYFSWISRSSCASQTTYWNVFIIFCGKSFKFVVCLMGVFSDVF